MATITATERARLGQIRPELWQLVLALNDAANQQLGFRLAIPPHGGTRSTAEQAALYNDSLAQGNGSLAYPVATPGSSRHEYGAAFDENIIAGGSNDDGTGSDDDYRQLADVARSLGLIAGYYFSHSDPYHFELAESLDDSKARWASMQHAGIVKAAAVGAAFVAAVGLGWFR